MRVSVGDYINPSLVGNIGGGWKAFGDSMNSMSNLSLKLSEEVERKKKLADSEKVMAEYNKRFNPLASAGATDGVIAKLDLSKANEAMNTQQNNQKINLALSDGIKNNQMGGDFSPTIDNAAKYNQMVKLSPMLNLDNQTLGNISPKEFLAYNTKDKKDFVSVAEGAALYDPNSGKQVYINPKTTTKSDKPVNTQLAKLPTGQWSFASLYEDGSVRYADINGKPMSVVNNDSDNANATARQEDGQKHSITKAEAVKDYKTKQSVADKFVAGSIIPLAKWNTLATKDKDNSMRNGYAPVFRDGVAIGYGRLK
jgi:hypothetical protein